ncbi:cobalamin-binding protein [sulfur-oxidizing endosymbiont of Gigantopelta aegis]|uniref:cobalamin-binding protein n=1 Tax=sulfur-oxidizing endosymbiont of Gigantopelta aegis TaxID=2794934 RepID=UPI0018DE8190|nr:cobalamin-binding protein [sulfur-oxidizing endosymbiont of Gigantopelta aegis]
MQSNILKPRLSTSVFSLFFLLGFSSHHAKADIQIKDDSGYLLHLIQPAKRVISLSPGLTELIYAAGGQKVIKGVVSYSDYPEQAKSLKQIGSYNALDMEKILLLKPDLIVAWKSGNPVHQIEQLRNLGLAVYVSEPSDFMAIPETIKKFGKLMATETIANQNANEFTQEFNHLKQHYNNKKNLFNSASKPRVFIQIWNKPVMSINQAHLISKVISFCGGENIFAQTKSLTSNPSIEAILSADPEIIIATGMADASKVWLNRWRQWAFLSAVKNNRLYATNPDHLVRHTPRILLGIKEVCQLINPE